TTATEGRIDVRGDAHGLAIVTSDNRSRLNAMGSAMLAEYARALAALAAETGLRAVAVPGTRDRSLLGGADIAEMAPIGRPAAAGQVPGVGPRRDPPAKGADRRVGGAAARRSDRRRRRGVRRRLPDGRAEADDGGVPGGPGGAQGAGVTGFGDATSTTPLRGA